MAAEVLTQSVARSMDYLAMAVGRDEGARPGGGETPPYRSVLLNRQPEKRGNVAREVGTEQL